MCNTLVHWDEGKITVILFIIYDCSLGFYTIFIEFLWFICCLIFLRFFFFFIFFLFSVFNIFICFWFLSIPFRLVTYSVPLPCVCLFLRTTGFSFYCFLLMNSRQLKSNENTILKIFRTVFCLIYIIFLTVFLGYLQFCPLLHFF